MDDKISDAEIDRLRAVVGMNSDSGNGGDTASSQRASLLKKSAPPAPTPALERQEQKQAENQPVSQHSNIDTELFVKIEEHAEIGSKLAESKGDMKTIADIISLLAKAEKLKSEAISRMEHALDKLDVDIEGLEQKLVPPEGLHIPEITAVQNFVSDDLIDLRSELDSLKDELGKMHE